METRKKYQEFVKNKTKKINYSGIKKFTINNILFPFQKDTCEYLLKIGRGAAFLDTGLGKTLIQLEWAKNIPGKVIIVAPLAVASQTEREAKEKLGFEIYHSRDGSIGKKITITNYEQLHRFNLSKFNGVVLDESSILKSFMGKTKNMLCDSFNHTKYRLCCSATPAPNDYMELGNHCEFLGICKREDMLTKYFIHDSAKTSDWRIKNHAIKPFWKWVSSWSVCINNPNECGYNNKKYNLPELIQEIHTIETDITKNVDDGYLFRMPEISAASLHKEKKYTIESRIYEIRDIVNRKRNDSWIIWCESNQESELLKKEFPEFVEVKGNDKIEDKENKLIDFSTGKVNGIITKPSIAGFGLNWQHCNNIVFASVSYSYEKYYQAVRRSWRFGQKKPVKVHIVMAQTEKKIWDIVVNKNESHNRMKTAMKYAKFTKKIDRNKIEYNPKHKGVLPTWLIQNH